MMFRGRIGLYLPFDLVRITKRSCFNFTVVSWCITMRLSDGTYERCVRIGRGVARAR